MAPKSVTFRRHDHLVSVLFGDLLSHSYNITFSMFLYLVKVQFDKSQYSTVGRSSCLVYDQWMKDQSRTVNPCLFKCMYSSCT